MSADKLIAVESKNDIIIYALDTARIVASYTPPGQVTALLTDPTLDYAFMGLQNGV